jgi:hypothetical protein
MNATIITRNEMISMFASIKGCSFVGMDTDTIPKLTGGKGNEHQGRVHKVSTFVAFGGDNVSYENMVNKKATAEFKDMIGEKPMDVKPFVAESMWKGAGEKVSGAVIRHKETDAKYVYLFMPSNGKPKVDYYLDGQPIDKDKIIGLPVADDEKEVVVDGLAVTITLIPRTFKAESVKAFRLDGQEYIIKENI